MSNDLRKYIDVISEAIAPGHFTTQQSDMEQKDLADKVLETEKNIDELMQTGEYQGRKQQIHDVDGKPLAGQFIVTLNIPFTFISRDNNTARVRIPGGQQGWFDVTTEIKTSDTKKFLELLAQKYQKAGWNADSHVSGEKGLLRISHNISDTVQG
jgi:hypothetical protein